MNQKTIRAELEDYLKRNYISINQFAEASGVNSGTLSNIINGNRSISMLQLDRITECIGLTEGSLYDLYIDDCFNQQSLNWRRLRPLLYRCAELNMLDCIGRLVGMLTDNLAYTPLLFDIAEDLFNQGQRAAALLLYERVAESEKYQHSERLALCQYRIFTITTSEEHEVKLRAAVQFEGYVNRLDEMDQLDALKDLANTYITLQKMDKIDKLARKMGDLASIHYKNRYEICKKEEFHKDPTMPLFTYIIYAHVLCTSVCVERGDYDMGLHYVSLYSDTSWVREDTEEAHRLMNQCKMWAKANSYLIRLMKGEFEVLPEYVAYIEQYEEEILLALFMILQIANRHQFNVDDILLRFEHQIPEFKDRQGEEGRYNPLVIEDRYAHFMAEIALYYMNRGEYEKGMKYMLAGLEAALKINSKVCIIRYVGLFEQFRYAASLESQINYKNLICNVQNNNLAESNLLIMESDSDNYTYSY
ncbi:transcriptional regulator with XRE-family HTH domain [Paenibacillus anaericanus]|uniref:helix-turn-helix transcriptional regulator n=1 Tax=Paenibacillus anaericanus TaxID=170367 RepID=UPI0027875FB8|nr:helix-turn-helix transcriptional regulator [Paenibacillus anaericanus]MDQ0090000.1 transcriptional regulator with XRE-family HTH domain [Paenibacillus anaericanus]